MPSTTPRHLLLYLGLLTNALTRGAPFEKDDLVKSVPSPQELSLSNLISRATSYPLSTSGRYIVNPSGDRVKLRCVNWAGSSETRIPEGLQMQALDTITTWIAKAGFNCVRLTYSIDLALNPDQLVSDSFSAAAASTGEAGLTDVLETAIERNAWLATSTTRNVYAEIITSLNTQGLMVVLDNHNSHASWCCSNTDGNGWWDEATGYTAANSQHFNTTEWLQGLSAMATFALDHANVVGLALRNELRPTAEQDGNSHADWYKYQAQGAAAIHDANPDALVIIGGTNYAIDLSFYAKKQLDLAMIGIADKAVFEFHSYTWSNSYTTTDCAAYQKLLDDQVGYLLTADKAYTAPLWLSEFGWNQESYAAGDAAYRDCLVEYMENLDVDWAYWALQGSYYVRNGINTGESYGLLTDDWSAWRNESFTKTIGQMMDLTQGPGATATATAKKSS